MRVIPSPFFPAKLFRVLCVAGISFSLFGCTPGTNPISPSRKSETIKLDWIACDGTKQIELHSIRTDRGDPAVACHTPVAHKPIVLTLNAQVSPDFTGPKQFSYIYRLKGWKSFRYIAVGFEKSPSKRALLITPPWSVKQDQWVKGTFDTSETFYFPAYQQILHEDYVHYKPTFLVYGVPGPDASVEVGMGPVSASPIEEPLSAPITLRISGKTIKSPDSNSEIREYFKKKPPVQFQPRLSLKITATQCLKQADDIVRNNRYQLGNFAPVILPDTLTWNESPFTNPNWHFWYHSLSFVDTLTTAYQVTKKKIYLDKATEIVDSWIRRDMLNPNQNDQTWEDAVTGVRLIPLLRFWEIYRVNDPEPQFLARLLQAIHLHGRLLASPRFYAKRQQTQFHNHAMLQDAGLLVLTRMLPEFSETGDWQKIVYERTLLQAQNVTVEGVHKEHSPSYHFMTMTSLAYILDGLGHSKKRDVLEKELFPKMAQYMAYAIAPNGDLPLWGDSDPGDSIQRKLVSAAKYPDLYYSLTQGRQGQQPSSVDAIFPQSGYAFFRTSWGKTEPYDQATYVAFSAAFHSLTHKHFDDLSFVVYALGEWWLVDPGLYTYDANDPLYSYYRSFPAHNTIVIDGYTPPSNADNIGKSGITDWKIEKSVCVVEATHRLIPEVSIKRTLYYLKPNLIILMDEITSEAEHSITFPLHFPASHTVRKVSHNTWIVRSRQTGHAMKIKAFWSNLTGRIIKGTMNPHVQGWISPDYNMCLEAPVLELSTRGQNLKSVTIIELPTRNRNKLDRKTLESHTTNLPELKSVIRMLQ